MSGESFVLIVTDGDDSIDKIAQGIKNAASGFDVKLCHASEFEGTDLLRCSAFFLGCGAPKAPSFSYIQDMLSHINLASRKCGTFAYDKKASQYLADIIKDSEAFLKAPLVVDKSNESSFDEVTRNYVRTIME